MKKQKTIPPAHAQKLLVRFLRNDLAEEVLGDLDEKFYDALMIEAGSNPVHPLIL